MLSASSKGELFSKEKHTGGTEIKVPTRRPNCMDCIYRFQAITYSAMQIHEGENRADVYVIVDI